MSEVSEEGVEFFTPSPGRKIAPYSTLPHWEACPVGRAFPVGFDMVRTESALRSFARDYGKRSGKRFRVTKHVTAYEIARTE